MFYVVLRIRGSFPSRRPRAFFARSPVFGRYLLSTHRTIHVIVRLLACVRVS